MLYRYNSTIMWRKTDKIGCYWRTCSERLSNNLCQAPTPKPFLVICRYGSYFIPNSKIDSNSDPFTPGPACTACPDGTECDGDLCTCYDKDDEDYGKESKEVVELVLPQ